MLINEFKPDFYDKFRCIGGDCKYTCCGEWNIDVSKKDYYNVKNAKMSKELREVANACYKRHKLPESDKKFAIAALNEHGYCILLDKQGLCRLQVECGGDMLSGTCREFPREKTYTPTGLERSLTISCEAVVKLLIDQGNGINFVQDKYNLAKAEPGQHGFYADKFESMPIAAYYWDIKALGLMILQCQAHSLDDRMLLLGIAMQELDKMAVEGRLSEIPSYVDRTIASIESINVGELFGNVGDDGLMALEKVMHMLFSISVEKFRVHIEFSERTLVNLGCIQMENDKQFHIDMETYRKARERLSRFEEIHPRAMENIMVNEFHRHAIPLNTDFKIWDSYIQFVYEYVFIKLTAAGYLDDSVSEEDFIHAVVMIGRRYGHSTSAGDVLTQKTKEREIASLGYLAIMIKG